MAAPGLGWFLGESEKNRRMIASDFAGRPTFVYFGAWRKALTADKNANRLVLSIVVAGCTNVPFLFVMTSPSAWTVAPASSARCQDRAAASANLFTSALVP